MQRFSLEPHIKLGCRVASIEPLEKSSGQHWKHRVKYTSKHNDNREQTFDCSHIAICTGLHVEPNIPSIPGIENINGEIFHSSSYKKRSQLTGRDVLVMGCGETAMGMCIARVLKFKTLIATRHRLRGHQSRCKISNDVLPNRLPLLPQSPLSLQSVRQAIQRRPTHRWTHYQPLRNGLCPPSHRR